MKLTVTLLGFIVDSLVLFDAAIFLRNYVINSDFKLAGYEGKIDK